MKEFEYIITQSQKGQRLDQFLSLLPELSLSRSQIKKLIENKLVIVNKEPSKPSYRIKLDDRIKVFVPPPAKPEAKPENLPLNIVYEDEDLIVVNKPKAMVTHPAAGNYSGTLVNALLYHCHHLASLGGPLRPGIVHRLDKDTSGLLVVAKNDFAYQSLVKQIKNHTVERTYLALVHGELKNNEGIIEARMGRHPVHRKKMAVIKEGKTKSREAITYYRVLERFKKYTLVEVKIKTGRTHQIRVHFSYIGHPVVGDKTYGKKKEEFEVKGQLLHAKKLGFIHPRTEKYLEFVSELPEEFKEILQKIT
ncbi:MAG: RluA family pseudouridine synthase [Candidatus Margulisiibacteriota bacterium]